MKKIVKEMRRRNPYDYKYQYLKKDRSKHIKILGDEQDGGIVRPHKEFDFERYADTIVSMINGSCQRFSVGIYGEWGTGKTTLMKLIENSLKPNVFYWNNVPGKESIKLKEFLKQNFDDTDWIESENLDFQKIDNGKKITYTDGNNFISINLKGNDKAILEFNDVKIYDFFAERGSNEMVIKENNILTVWFNAWRYEREEEFALIPLMKTIAFAMGEHPIYKSIKPILIKGIENISKGILHNLTTKYLLTSEDSKDFEKKLFSKLENLYEIDKDTIYFDGIKKIEEKMESIFENHPNSKVVVFIDDLDRCSPETALEVFESIKVFLEMKGIVFVVGLSRETLDKLIEAKYEKMGLKDISAKQYISKIIQIEINIQKWQNYAIDELIKKLSLHLDKKMQYYLKENINLNSAPTHQNY